MDSTRHCDEFKRDITIGLGSEANWHAHVTRRLTSRPSPRLRRLCQPKHRAINLCLSSRKRRRQHLQCAMQSLTLNCSPPSSTKHRSCCLRTAHLPVSLLNLFNWWQACVLLRSRSIALCASEQPPSPSSATRNPAEGISLISRLRDLAAHLPPSALYT